MQGQEQTTGYRCGCYFIDPAQRRLRRDGEDVPLEAKVFDLILLLVERRERALGKQEVVEALWGQRPISDAALSQLVYKARRAFDDDGKRGNVIRTVYGRGLQWVAPVEPIADAGDSLPAPAIGSIPVSSAKPARRRPRLALGLVALLALAAAGLWLIPTSKAPPVPAPPRLALLPTENATGEKALDWVGHGLPGLMTSLLGESRDVDAIDALQVARIWDYTPPPGRSRAEHARFAAHADILVGSRLRKLADHLYELDVHVDAGGLAPPADIAVTGEQPATLGMQAVERIRHALKLEPAARAPGARPADAYLAETFARGLDEAMRGRWVKAKPYFRLCAQNAAGFLPARFRLGQAQVNTDESDAGEQTLQQALAGARAQGDDALAANSLLQLAALALTRHRHADALALLDRAAPLAERARDPALGAAIALKAVNAAARLHQLALARRHLSQARGLIERHQLRQLEGDLHNSEGFIAEAQGDLAASETANRAALAASEAVGNERNARGDAYNLALVLAREGKNAEAMKLFAHTYRRARGIDPWLTFASGDNLAIALLNAGLGDRVEPIAAQLLATAKEQHNRVWQSLAWMLRAGSRWYQGDAAASLAHCRTAGALIDPAQDPALRLAIQLSEASAALVAEPQALAAIAHDADRLIDAQQQPNDYAYERQLIHAMAASAARQPAQARDALKAAAAGPHPSDATADNLHYIGLTIALRDADKDAAALALAGFDPGASSNADVLRLYAQWAERQGDRDGHARATARLASLRTEAQAALAAEPFDEALASP
ncbi:winged helix-turn-helix domain-containing protein [Frateuria hangzhouensis]|uniref:winged helix-turn-helix domain-containing protein n=1 Tax=Frateuria hangzhouensis TaxID=2995589 RepID=UPI002260C097|nr:winged helix-turn-helix domain-containing protein [Frateuria sp. STR12]MCX7513602.1 winged helix-turn-helix domain-containing protein [Frateuria sp. STR12]